MSSEILKQVSNYYTQKLKQHGTTHNGVDWSSQESQKQRFAVLCQIITSSDHFTLTDWGCGYGAMYEFLLSKYKSFSYTGIDISEKMVQAAKKTYKETKHRHFLTTSDLKSKTDYVIASGIFNTKKKVDEQTWLNYILSTLDKINKAATKGFAFNCLTKYSDHDKMRDDLYYADPTFLFDHCKQHYAKNIALLHDYDLYEFTILVRKTT